MLGSSPRVQGTRHHVIGVIPVDRFIPACAGNAIPRSSRAGGETVHPRVCRERWSRFVNRSFSRGSSPRVQGTHFDRLAVRLFQRFIPACAGNARYRRRGRQVGAVHPRVCRERAWIRRVIRWADGSSPRVQGTLFFFRERFDGMRFIPACAGNAGKSSV